jgi:hypothetical protein
MRNLAGIALCASLLSACGAHGLKSYWLGLVAKSGAEVAGVTCRMNAAGRSRAGICRFQAAPEAIDKITQAWLLKSVEPGAGTDGCVELDPFSTAERLQMHAVAKDGFRKPYLYTRYHVLTGVRMYRESKPLPPISPGNATSPFRALYYNPKTQDGCADLEYPYG